jgi:hypothetical protein
MAHEIQQDRSTAYAARIQCRVQGGSGTVDRGPACGRGVTLAQVGRELDIKPDQLRGTP